MVKSLYTGVSGLKTHQKRMDVIGNNIANVNTLAYKSYQSSFKDVYYQTQKAASGTTATLGGTNARQVGYGVTMNATSANMTQSGYTFSDNVYDMALDGDGFFQLMDGKGNTVYTRAGAFFVDEQGYLVNSSGYHVLGISGVPDGQPADSEIIRLTVPATQDHCSSATKKINGTNVTLSVSAPSDNTDMSVTFTDADYPFATFANGILNVYFDMDEQFESVNDFQETITEAINAGGVTLPDDVTLNFDIETIPQDYEAVAASNSVQWTYTTLQATANTNVSYTKTSLDPADPTKTKTETAYARIDFTTNDTVQNGIEVKLTYDDSLGDKAQVTSGPLLNADGDSITGTGDSAGAPTNTAATAWEIKVGATAGAAAINKAIKDFIEINTKPDANGDTIKPPSLTCTRFNVPSKTSIGSGKVDNRDAVFDALDTLVATKPITLACTDAKGSTIDVDIKLTEAGAYANNYKVIFEYRDVYDYTKASWDENTLTITVSNDSSVTDIQRAINEAANGDKKKMLEIEGLTDLATMNASMRKEFFGGNPSVSFGNGADSFFTEVAKTLTTFSLTNGRIGSPQDYSSVSNVTIYEDGTIVGEHPVHGFMTLGRIDIATFENPNGLASIGGTLFQETVASGEAQVNRAGENGAGVVLSQTQEMSNVDLAEEFTGMIATQRGYQANSRVVTTSDTMLEELLNLKR